MNIWIIRLKRITAVIAVSPGIALAGEAQTKAKISISDAKDVCPNVSITSRTAMLSPSTDVSSWSRTSLSAFVRLSLMRRGPVMRASP
jgi:hypothetical protein